MSNEPECQICALKVGDNAYVCSKCSSYLRRNLADVVFLAAEVETTRLRQAKTAKTAGIGIVLHVAEEDRPLPFNDRPIMRARELRLVLTGFAAQVAETRGLTPPAPNLTHLSRFLLANSEWIRHREDAADWQREMEHAIEGLRSTIDLPPDRVFAGPCGAVDYACQTDHDHGNHASCDPQPVPDSPPCTGSLFGRSKKAKVALCDLCGSKQEMGDLRDWLIKAVEDQLDYAARLSQALSNLGRPVADSTIRKWAERGRLVAHSHDERDRPLYRVGDVMDLITEDVRRTELAARKKEAS